MKNKSVQYKALGAFPSFSIYIFSALLLWFQTRIAIPQLSAWTGWEPVLFWFITAGLGVFLPLIIIGYILLRKEGFSLSRSTFKNRLWFRPMTGKDWKITGITFLAAGLLSFLIMQGLTYLLGEFSTQPPFMTFEPLTPGRYWYLLVWLPYWFLNILGEEFLWRGVMLPRQEVAWGKSAYFWHGLGWLIFHIPFGWGLIATMLPLLILLPRAVQKQQNSWIGVILHAVINGPAFIAIALGYL